MRKEPPPPAPAASQLTGPSVCPSVVWSPSVRSPEIFPKIPFSVRLTAVNIILGSGKGVAKKKCEFFIKIERRSPKLTS